MPIVLPAAIGREKTVMENELQQARETFITESGELLQDMEDALLILENSPDDQDTINSLFRSAHTIKGASGILGLDELERFTHVAESLLSRVRDKEISITGEIIELLLVCRDHISGLVELAASDAAVPPEVVDGSDGIMKKLNRYLAGEGSGKKAQAPAPEEECEPAYAPAGALAGTGAWHISLRFGPDVMRAGMDPASFVGYLPKLGEIVSLTTILESIPNAEEMDPESCYLGFEIDFKSEFDKKSIADVFEFVREDCQITILPPHSSIESYIDLIESLPEDVVLLGEILIKGGALTQAELNNALEIQKAQPAEARGRIGEIMVGQRMVHPEVADAALARQKTNKSKEAATIRIDAAKLDTLVDLVGELVISSAAIGQHAQRIEDGSLLESTSIMMRLVEELRDNTMKARMVPIGDTFSRFNRMVRDIGREIGKEMDLLINGGETELDKTVVEKINDPLIHLVRNAADHGLEDPAVRRAGGKPERGKITLNAMHDAGCIVIEVCDDGKGLDRDRILEKALAQGLITAGHALSDSEIFSLIFEPGFSTAEQVTKLSGRGVGMDVVKKNIDALRGTVEVESRKGEGTTVRIRLPLTLAIIDGFMVGIGADCYVIPLDMVVECVELPSTEKKDKEQGYVNLRGQVLPYIRMSGFLGRRGNSGRFENIVIVQYAGQKVGLVVDELFGEVQTVIKSLSKVYRNVKGISGATILGNGKVALILDVHRLIQSVENVVTAEAV